MKKGMKLKIFHSVDCADGHEKCEEWADAGECEKNSLWMQMFNCKMSCGICGDKTKGKSLKILVKYIHLLILNNEPKKRLVGWSKLVGLE